MGEGLHLPASAARKLLREILASGRLFYSDHAKKKMARDRLTPVDVVNVLRAGVVEPSELEHGSWRHRGKDKPHMRGGRHRLRDDGGRCHHVEDSPMTRCVTCGGATKTKREKSYRYAECGLPNVVLENVVEVSVCTKCGGTYTGIPAIEGLHRAIAGGLIRKKRRLAPAEIKFLRKSLGWSGVDFAKRMGATPETVSRWENGKVPMGAQADRLLRLLVAREAPIMEYSVDVLAQLAADGDSPATPAHVEMTKGARGWRFVPGPALVAGGA
jgi:putative transcriptional regulator